MKRLVGGEAAESGFYWHRRRWEIVSFEAGAGTAPLEGGPGDAYLKVPAAVALAIAPLMGGLFAMFLPLIGFLMVFREVGARAVRAVRRGGAAGSAVSLPRP